MLFIAESQASNEADHSTDQGFLSNYAPSGFDASQSSMSDYDKFITPNFNRVKQGNGPDALSFAPNGASTKPVRGGRPKDFGFLKDLGLEKPSEEPKAEEEEASEEESADSEEKQAAEFATNSNNPISLSAIGIGLLSVVTMLVVRWRRGLQPATALGENLMEMKSQDSNVKVNSGRVGWGQLSSQSARPLTSCEG